MTATTERIVIQIRVTKEMKEFFQAGAAKVGQNLTAYVKGAVYDRTSKLIKK